MPFPAPPKDPKSNKKKSIADTGQQAVRMKTEVTHDFSANLWHQR